MPPTYSVYIDWNDDGAFADAGEDVTADVLHLAWRLGMTEPRQHVAPPGTATVRLRSRDRAYSPEASPLPLLPGKRLRIQSTDNVGDDGTTTRTHFTGYIRRVEPQPGTLGERTAVLHVETADAQFAEAMICLPPLVNTRSDAVVTALLDRLPLRRAGLVGMWVLEVSGQSELDTHAYVAADETIPRSVESGISTFAYVDDLWALSAQGALRETVESERGRFFIHRDGTAVFYNRHHALRASAPIAAFDDAAEGLRYAFGETFANHVQVTVIPRKVGAAGSPLWTLENAQPIPPGTRRITVSYRAADGSRMGALHVSALSFSANTQPDGTGISASVHGLIVEAGGSAAVLEFRNESGSTAYVLPGAQLTGTPLLVGVPITIEHTDHTSVTFYGQRTLALDVPLVDSADEADQIARYERHLRSRPQGDVIFVETSTRTHPQHVLARTLFDRIRVRETQTGHDADYWIVGEQHEVDLGGARHRARWVVERADPTLFWQVELCHLDQTTTVAY